MVKICDTALAKPVSIIFKNCIKCETFQIYGKKSNICPIHLKNEENVAQN